MKICFSICASLVVLAMTVPTQAESSYPTLVVPGIPVVDSSVPTLIPTPVLGAPAGVPTLTPVPEPVPEQFAPLAVPHSVAMPPVVLPPMAVPQAIAPPAIYGGPAYQGMPVMQEIPLFTKVKYRRGRKIHPCAETTFICVPNPCYDKCIPGSPQCVLVQICVPPCAVAKIKVRRRGNRLKYDYGKYAVNVIIRKRDILVRYSS